MSEMARPTPIPSAFYSSDEIASMGFRHAGKNVLLSRKASIYSPKTISLGDNVRIDDFCILTGDVDLGSYIHIGASTLLIGAAGITMGDYSTLSGRVAVYSVSDDYLGAGMTNPMVPEKYRRVHSGPVRIGRHVIVGAGTVILPNVRLEEGVAVGAMSLVIGSIKEWQVASGVPARPRALRKKDVILAFQAELERRR